MKSNKTHQILAAVLVTVVCGIASVDAQNAPPAPGAAVQKVLAPVESLVNKNTFVLAYIDVKAFDLDKTVANWKQLVTDMFSKIKEDKRVTNNLAEAGINLDAIQAEYFEYIDKNKLDIKMWFDDLQKTEVKEIYVLANSRVMAMAPVRIVATFDNNRAPDAFLAMMLNPWDSSLGGSYSIDEVADEVDYPLIVLLLRNSLIEKRDNMLIFSVPSPAAGLNMANPSDKARLQRMFDAIKPEENPAIAAGLERVKGAPIQIVLAPDSSIRGMVTMGLAMAPAPANKFGGKTLTDGVQWASAGLDPVKQIFALTIQSASPEAAQTLHDTVSDAFDGILGQVGNELGADSTQAIRAYAERIKVFVPQVKGDRLQLVVNKQFLETQMSSLTSLTTTLLPAIMAAREAAKRAQCSNNIKRIVLAMHNYHDANKMFPPVMATDTNGKPLHSWRVLLLPYLDCGTYFSQVRMNEPWDSEYNKRFHDFAPYVYRCPSANSDMTGMTSYSVVVGKECLFNEPNARKTFAAITDGTSNTIAIVERKTPVCWMDPTQEIPFEEAVKGINVSANGLGGNHTGGINVGLFDGSVHFISDTIPPAVLRALFTCAGGESVSF